MSSQANTVSEDLRNEIEAINSIYDQHTLVASDGQGVYLLSVPHQQVAIRLAFPPSYPKAPPNTAGTESLGLEVPRGHASKLLRVTQKFLDETFQSGEVCIFGLIEELQAFQAVESDQDKPAEVPTARSAVEYSHAPRDHPEQTIPGDYSRPDWTLSQPFTEKKSTFVARVTSVQSPGAARNAIADLLATEKKIAKATHNITAYRIRDPANPVISFQDCDDDGETAAGRRLLHMLQVMDVWNRLVIVTRWYGGIKLGPDRFRLINQAAREAIVSSIGQEDKAKKHSQ